jgi:phage nucleotide-binding protein
MVKITSAEDIQTNNETYLIYSAPGMGKTSTARYFKGKTLVLDMDRTSHVLRGLKNIDVIYVDNQNTWKEWGDLIKELSKMDLSKYDNIVLDNISELERCIALDVTEKTPCSEMRHYQQCGSTQFFKEEKCSNCMTDHGEDGQQFNRYPDKAKVTTSGLWFG